MAQSTRTPVARQLEHLRTTFAQQPGLPFADLLPDNTPQLLGADTDDTIYTPLVTNGMFLGQVLDPNESVIAPIVWNRERSNDARRAFRI